MNKIILTPIGSTDEETLATIKQRLTETFAWRVEISPQIEHPDGDSEKG